MASILTKLTKCATALPAVKVLCANRKFIQEQVIKLSYWGAPAAIAAGWLIFPALTPAFKQQVLGIAPPTTPQPLPSYEYHEQDHGLAPKVK
eukprot:gene6675-7377_t